MQRRGESGQAVKRRRTIGRKARKARSVGVSTTELQEQVAALTRELKEAREQHTATLARQTATSEILRTISTSPTEIGLVFDAILENAIRLCGGDVAVLWQFDGRVLRFAAGNNASSEAHLRAHPVELGTYNPTALAGLEQRIVHELDVFANPAYRPLVPATTTQRPRSSTVLAVPLVREGKLLGVITIWRFEKRLFTDKQIELLKNFAAQAVIAIENTRLLNELRQRTDDLSESLEQQTATSEVLQAISSSPGELGPVFEAMLENAVRICRASFGTLLLYEGDRLRRVARMAAQNVPQSYASDQETPPHFIAPFDGAPSLGRLVETKALVHIADIATEHPDDLIYKVAAARTVLIVPMLKESDLVGAFAVYRKEVQKFSDKQVELLENFAAQAVIAIENTRLLSELRHRTDDLSEALEQQIATSEVLKIISSSPGELEPVFNAMLENATRICEAQLGVLMMFEAGAFRYVTSHGVTPAYAEAMRRDPVFRPSAGHPLDRLASTKQVIHIPDARVEQNMRGRLVELAGARTFLCVPMLKDNELVGTIAIYRQEVRPFTDKQIALVQNFAAQAVIAIENTRLLNELRESLQQQTATADVLKVISSSPGDLAPVFKAMLENAVHICEAKFGHMFLSEGEAFRVVALESGTLPYPDWLREGSKLELRANPQGPLAQIAATGKIVHIGDLTDEPPYRERNPRMVALVESSGARTFLGVPMFRGETLMGAIGIYRQEVRPFTDKQIALVQNFAAQAVIAIENSRLLNELRQRTHELATSLDDLRNTQDRLVQTQKLASLGQLTAGIAHEIKNPLNFVNNFSVVSSELIDELQDVLKRVSADDKTRAEIKELTDTLHGNLDKVVQHGKRADAIVKNMLLHSREGSGEHRPVDVNAIVEESLNLAYHGARAEKQGFTITLQRSFDPTVGEADIFPQDITRALLNLIINGFYAATKRRAEANGGKCEPILAATTKNLGDRVEITIRDNGTGIPPDVRAKMFNPFFTTKPAGEGTGLGLSISHDIIVKQHGGSIEVDTQPGEFTEIRVILPRVAAFV